MVQSTENREGEDLATLVIQSHRLTIPFWDQLCDALMRSGSIEELDIGMQDTERNRLQAEAQQEMQELWDRVSRVLETSHKKHTKWQRYCREQGDLLRALEVSLRKSGLCTSWTTARIRL